MQSELGTQGLTELEGRIRDLEARVAALEGGRTTDTAEGPGALALADPSDPAPLADYLVHVAVACFVLVGALVLRVATLSGVLPALAGTVAGLAYSAGLVVLPAALVPSRRPLAAYATLLHACGAALAPLVLLEMHHRSHLAGVGVTAVLLAVAGAAGALAAVRLGRRVPAAIALGMSAVAIGVLSRGVDDVALRAGALVSVVALGLVLSHRLGWAELRAVVLVPALVALMPALFIATHRQGVSVAVADTFAATVATIWALTMVSLFVRRRELTIEDAGWLAAVTLWAYAAGHLHPLEAARLAAVGVAAVFLLAARATSIAEPGRVALVGTGALLALEVVPAFDRTGLAMTAAALLAARARVSGPMLLAPALLATVAAVLAGLWLAGEGATTPLEVPMGVVTGGGLLALYVAARRRPERDPVSFTGTGMLIVPLAASLATTFLALRRGALWILGPGDGFELTQTGLIAVSAVLVMNAARLTSLSELRTTAYVLLAILGANVLLGNLVSLEGAAKVTAVVILGFASWLVAASAPRRQSRPTPL